MLVPNPCLPTLGQIAAQDSRFPLALAFLLANEAFAYAHQGNGRQAVTAFRRAEDEFAHVSQDDQHPEFTRFSTSSLATPPRPASTANSASTTPSTAPKRFAHLNRTLAATPTDHGRQRAVILAWLATCTLADGDLSTGTEIGRQALDAVREVISNTQMWDSSHRIRGHDRPSGTRRDRGHRHLPCGT